MSSQTELTERLERDHARLAAGFARAKLSSRLARRTRRFAARKTLALLAGAFAGVLATAIATYSLASQAHAEGAIPAVWLITIAICASFGALAGFVLLLAQEGE